MAEIEGDLQRILRHYLVTKACTLNLTLQVEHRHDVLAGCSRTEDLLFVFELIRINLFQIDQVLHHAQEEI